MKKLIGNGSLITRDPQNPWIQDGCVCIEGPTIIDVGERRALLDKYPDAQWVDARGGVIMPGLINTHHHIYSAFARGLSIKNHHPENFGDILEGMWWRLDRLLTLEDCRFSAYATYLSCLRNGVTTVFDHHASYGATEGSLFEIGAAAREIGIRTCLCYEVSDRNGQEAMRQAVQENEAFIKAAAADPSGMQKGMMGLHASFTLSDATLDYCAARKPVETGYHIHVAEGLEDVYDSLRKYNKRIVNRLFDRGILGPRTLAIHCIHIDPQEIQILKDTDTMVVHNPESNMGNAVGCEPMPALMAKGVLLGLGTDGYTSDMLESYKVANLIHKHHLGDPNAAWGEVPRMLFENNAAIANRYFDKPLGMLKPGYGADVIICDYDPLTPMDGGNCNSHILFGMSGLCVTTVIIDGKISMQDRRIEGLDEAEIMAKCREQARALWGRING